MNLVKKTQIMMAGMVGCTASSSAENDKDYDLIGRIIVANHPCVDASVSIKPLMRMLAMNGLEMMDFPKRTEISSMAGAFSEVRNDKGGLCCITEYKKTICSI
jgi:hypothetical protein